MKLANDILDRYADRLRTRRVVCGAGLTRRMPALLGRFLPPGRWLLIADERTWAAQGRALADALADAGRPAGHLLLAPASGRDDLVCETGLVERVCRAVRTVNPSAVVAVGAGTICDTVKLAAAEAGLPNAAVATAPSMNGYPSVIAAVLRDGVKRTEPTTPPLVVLADLDTLCAAPARMIAAGLADLLAKPVSTADWTLAHELLGDELSADGLAVVEESARLADGIAPALSERRPAAVGRLFEALFVSGLAMAVSGVSSPASGGEHLISHYLDMTALSPPRLPRPSRGRKLADSAQCPPTPPPSHDLHGLQVGVATLATAAVYRRLLALDLSALDVAACVRSRRPWRQVEGELVEHFGPALAPSVIAEASRPYAEGEELAKRLSKLRACWADLRGGLARQLDRAEQIEPRLAACGAATRFSQIGVDRRRALSAVRLARHVRARYTVLHLAADLGVLDDWAEQIAAELA